ncbi:MAG: hypothetical protein GF347_00500 [Candidatus Moranbacteria bacterium]|nr:hypothetical protein [Candidatus Moranbacteria bacterium]
MQKKITKFQKSIVQKRLNSLILIAILVVIDQALKFAVTRVPPILEMSHLCNAGIAFGFKLMPQFILLLNILILSWLIYCLVKKSRTNSSFLFIFALILLTAGAVSNTADRINFGCVIDYIDLKIWPVFNLADTYISISFILLIFHLLKENKKAKKQ